MKIQESKEGVDYGKLFVSYIPILTFISLGIGIVKQLVYYYFFHLDILNYIDVNEILLGTITNLIKCILIILFFQFLTELFKFLRIIILKIENHDKTKHELNLTLKSINIISIVILVICASLFLFFYNKFDSEKIASVNQEWIFFLKTSFMVILLLIFSVIYFPLIYATNYTKSISSKLMSVFVAGIVVLTFTILFSLEDSVDTKLFSTFGTYIEIGNKKIMSDYNYYYIGRTRNFIFFYDVKEDYTDVYQNKDITLLALNNKGFLKTADELNRYNKLKDSIAKAKFKDSINVNNKHK
jgi:hypothetical protein